MFSLKGRLSGRTLVENKPTNLASHRYKLTNKTNLTNQTNPTKNPVHFVGY
jgi:hypothetical protein